MNPYSEDLRKKKIVQALRRGMSKSQAARAFWRLALLGQALRQDGRAGALARPQEEARL
jgi:transposase